MLTEWVAAARVQQIPPGQGQVVFVRDREIALFHLDGAFYAIDNVCSHRDASLAYGFLDGTEVICPSHGARFDLQTGKALSAPAAGDVRCYATKVEGETVFIALP